MTSKSGTGITLCLLCICALTLADVACPAGVGGGIWNCGGYPRRGTFGFDAEFVAGCELLYHWRELEPQPGTYRWDLIERDMKPWHDAGKAVALRVLTAGNRANAAPQWVFDAGAPAIYSASYSRVDIVFPVFWDPRFTEPWERFVREFAARFDGEPGVEYVQVGGVGRWGETYIHTENEAMSAAWQSAGYTHERYIEHCKKMADLYQFVFRETPVLLSISVGGPDPERSDRTLIGYALAEYAVEHGLYIKQNGWNASYTYTNHNHFSRIFRATRGKTKRIYEQGAGVSSTWGGPQGDIRSTLLRALMDGPDYLWIYDEDLRKPAFRDDLIYASKHLSAKSIRDLLPLPCQDEDTLAYIRFENQIGRYKDPDVVKEQGFSYFGLTTGGRWKPWPEDMSAEPVHIAGATGIATRTDAPYVYLDIEEALVEELGGSLGYVSTLKLHLRFLDSGGGEVIVEHNPSRFGWQARKRYPRGRIGTWRTIPVQLDHVIFAPRGEIGVPTWDFRLSASDGRLLVHSVSLSL